MSALTTAVVGLGPVGQLCAKIALKRPNLKLVSAADLDPQIAGQDLGLVLGLDRLGVEVSGSLEEALKKADQGVVVLCTTSYLDKIAQQIEACVSAGWHVVSTCEELAYPWQSRPEIADRLDRAAKGAKRAILGTGVNPGFAMDALPAFLSSVCRRVESVVVERFQDASLRRLPFQQKIGASLTLSEFEDKVKAGLIRHVGF
ncbi:MAG: dihydrodipicolinate reductase, partial [Deltaproteobacteria bacterium]|nr:dihydrodipicolinate reductase [Deltaproteobacteria bacterium]